MAARSVWKGVIQLHPLMQVPVAAYKATDGYEGNEPLKQVCACHSKPLVREEKCSGGKPRLTEAAAKSGATEKTHAKVVRAVMVADDDYRIVDEATLEGIGETFTSGVITVDAVLPYAAVPMEWVDDTMFLGAPRDVAGADEAIAALAKTLAREGTVIIGRWSARGHENIVAIQAVGDEDEGILVMSRIRFSQEIRDDSPFSYDATGIDDEDVMLTSQLLATHAEAEFDHSRYEDAAVGQRADVIAQVKAGKAVVAPTADDAPAPATASLKEAMRAALADGKAKPAAKKAAGAKRGVKAKVGARR